MARPRLLHKSQLSKKEKPNGKTENANTTSEIHKTNRPVKPAILNSGNNVGPVLGPAGQHSKVIVDAATTKPNDRLQYHEQAGQSQNKCQ